MATQQAYRLHSYEGPNNHTLDTVPIPKPGKGEVLVEVTFAGVNPFDWKIRDGYVKDFLPIPLPTTLGVEVAGKVAAIGEDVTSVAVGDRIMAMTETLGGYAEYNTVPERSIVKTPAGLDDKTAVTLPVPALTAWQTLYAAGEVKPGTKILIHGASGSCGSIAVQLAKAAGAFVIGTGSARNKQYLLDLGADQVIDYKNEKFEDVVSDMDIVLDYVHVGGKDDTTDRSWAVLRNGGAFITAADPTLLGKIREGYRGFAPHIATDGVLLEPLAKQLAAGTLKTKIAHVYGRSEVNEAIDANKNGGTTGRLIVDFKKL